MNASISPRVLFLSLGAKIRIPIFRKIFIWFMQSEVVDFGDYGEASIRSRQAPINFMDKKTQGNVIKYLSSFDTSIVDFNVNQSDGSEEDKKYQINSVHLADDGQTKEQLPLYEESSGTQKMFALYQPIKRALQYGSVLYIDELNARLHPLLVRNIILTFLNKKTNPKHAQLIFTSHDAWQLSSDVFRRDEIWIVEKNEIGISSLTSLSEFIDEDGDKIRKDENYEKNYMLGKYGGIPPLTRIDLFAEDEDDRTE